MFEFLIKKLKAHPRKIVFTEGTDPRILEAASRLKKEGILEPLLVGNPEEVQAAAAKGGFDITDIRIIDPANYRRIGELAAKMSELRKGKLTALPIENLSMVRQTNILYHKDFSHPEVLQALTRLYRETAKIYA